jgi:hypothetical protein
VPSIARISFSLFPESTTGGASDDARVGEVDALAVAVADADASGAAGVVPVEGRGRGAGVVAAFFCGAAVGWDDVSRAKSLVMFRVASQPDRSKSPTLTVCLIRSLIVILRPILESPRDVLWPDCGTTSPQPPELRLRKLVADNASY